MLKITVYVKITSAFVFIAFQLAQLGRINELLTVKTSGLLFNFSAGRSFCEQQLLYSYEGDLEFRAELPYRQQSPDIHCNPGRLQAGVERLASRKTSLGQKGRFLFQRRESLCFTS